MEENENTIEFILERVPEILAVQLQLRWKRHLNIVQACTNITVTERRQIRSGDKCLMKHTGARPRR